MLKYRFFALRPVSVLTLFALFLGVFLPIMGTAPVANAATAGTGNCVQTVGNTTGVTVTQVGSDCVVTFTSGSNTWTVPAGVTAIRLLIVGGGAGGQADGGGGGGGGGAQTATAVSVTPGTQTSIQVGSGGGTGAGGNATTLDLNADGTAEWNAAGGSAGTGWSSRLGGNGGSPTTPPSGSTLTGGRGGDGPSSTSAGTNATNSGIGNGYQSDITGSTLWYGGGGGGGMGAQANGTPTGDLNGGDGGNGGGGRGAAQRANGTLVEWAYKVTGASSQTLKASQTAVCGSGANYPGATQGFPGLDGFGGGGGGGVAYGDGCAGSPSNNDGERTDGGRGGNGTAIFRYAISPNAPTINSVTGGNNSLSVSFTAPSDNGASVSSYQYSINNGSTWVSTGGTTSPFTISGLTNGNNYTVLLRALNGTSASPASSGVSALAGATCVPTTTSSNGYTYVAFRTVGFCNWNVPGNASSIDYLVVGGGGGGGTRHAGGGGAGGLLKGSTSISSVTTLSIEVGAGGAGGDTAVSGQNFAYGSNGNPSTISKASGAGTFNTLTADGGGGGVTGGFELGRNGGSGGGALATGGTATSGQGNNGGNGLANNPYWGGGGGGGAGAVGGNASQGVAGNGGAGTTWINDFTTAIATSLSLTNTVNVYFAGGGGGGGTSGTAGTGGIGGGGDGSAGNNNDGVSGIANTGGGGGGGGLGTVVPKGGNGGSGVVLLRYANPTRTITYSLNGGSGSAPIQSPVSDGTSFTVASDSGFNRTGFVFRGWSDGSNTYQSGSSYTVGANNITLNAVWQSLNLRLSYNFSDINSFDATANTTVTDLSGSNTNGTLTGNGTSIGTNGAMVLPGGATSSGPFVDVSDLSTTGFNTNGITIDFEADFGGVDLWERIIDFGVNGAQSSNVLVSRIGNTNNVGIEIYSGSSTLGTCSTGILSSLNRYTFVLNGTNCRIYKNGSLTDTNASYTAKPVSGLTWSTNFIGKSNWNADNSFAGEIRSLRIYEGAFTPSEIGAFAYKTVTFNTSNGGTASPSSKTTSGAIRLASATRSTYTSNGWFTSSSGGTKVGDAGASYTPSTDSTLYVQWTANSAISPTISSHPSNATKTAGQSATFSVTASSSDGGTLSYQWQKDGVDISGATANSYTIATLSTSEAGSYRVVVTNTRSGTTATVTSNAATLTVSSALTITTPTSGLNAAISNAFSLGLTASGGSGGNTFAVATGTLPNGLTISGNAISGTPTTVGTSSITIRVTDSNGATATTSSFSIIVRASCTPSSTVTSGGYTVITFTNTTPCNWIVPSGISNTEVLIVAGGGGGNRGVCGVNYGAGAGGGAVFLGNQSLTPGAATTVIVGKGGAAATGNCNNTSGQNGEASTFGSTQVNGGIAPTYDSFNGGASGNGNAGGVIGASTSPCGSHPNACGVGGGGGASSAGSGLNGGAGISSSISGSNVIYGGGGQGRNYLTVGTAGDLRASGAGPTANTGGGGTDWTAGADGVVIVKYAVTVNYTYAANNGTGSAPAGGSGQGGSAFTAAANTLTRSGFSFAGWNTAANGSGTAFSANTSGTLPVSATSIVLYAQWTAITHTITFNSNFGTPTTQTQTVNSGVATNLTTNSFTRSGYTFSGWTTNADGTGTSYTNSQSVTLSNDLTLYAKWTETFVVTYQYNGATGGNTTATSSFLVGGSAITLPTPTKTNAVFAGWYVSDEFDGNAIGSTYTPTQSITIYARWTEVTSAPSAPQNIQVTPGNQTLTLTWQAPARLSGTTITGYKVQYSTNGTSWTTASSSIAANTLTYTITDLTSGISYFTRVAALISGGRGAYGYPWVEIFRTTQPFRNTDKTIEYASGFGLSGGAASTNSGANFTRVRYLVKTTYGEQANYVDFNFDRTLGDKSAASTTYDSVAKLQMPTNNGGSSQFQIHANVNDLSVESNVAAVINGYELAGRVEIWPFDYAQAAVSPFSERSSGTYDDADSPSTGGVYGSFQLHKLGSGTKQTVVAWNRHFVTSIAQVEIGFGNYSGTNSDWTFCMQLDSACTSRSAFSWQSYANIPTTVLSQISITFDANGGTGSMAVQSINPNQATSLTANTFNRTGYTFAGWTTNANGTGTSYTNSQSVTINSDITIYAKWSANPQSITYAAGIGGSGTAPATPSTVLFGATFTTPSNTFNKIGYTFAGWSDGSSVYAAGATYPSSGTVAGAVTLTATWNPIACVPSESNANGYKVLTFTSTTPCIWTVPTGINLSQVAVVGGGGGGGFGSLGGGGGAGEVLVTGTASISSGTVTNVSGISLTPGDEILISIGTGGTSGEPTGSTITDASTAWYANGSTAFQGGDGTSTKFGDITARGGGGGGGSTGVSGRAGGSGGGAASNGSGGQVGSNSTPSGWTSFKNIGSAGSYGSGGGAGGAGSTRGGAGVTVLGRKVAGGGGGWGRFGAENSLTDTTLGGNGRLATGTWGYAGTAPNYTSPGTPGTGTGGGAGAPGGSGVIVVRFATVVNYSYNANGGTGIAPNGGSAQGGSSFTTAANPFTKNGSNFTGWNTAANGSGTPLTENALNTLPPSASAITLYAQWAATDVTVTFDANSGSGTMANQSIQVSAATALTSNLFTRDGYTFAGWNTQANGNGDNYTNGQSVTLTQNLSLFAKWTANQYTVTYNYNDATGGNGTASASFTTGGSAITLPTPVRTGYTFDGWYSDSGLSTPIGNAGASYSPTGTTFAITAYAKWIAINYTITYNSNSATSGSVPTDSTNYNIGQNITVKANSGSLVRTGYTFAGWNTQADGNGTSYLSGTQYQVGSANVTLYAKWSANTYTVTYNSNGASGSAQRGGSNVSSDSYTTGNAGLTLPSVGTLAKTGYDFGGWSTTPTGDALSGAYTTTANVTLYAKWTIKTITISFAKGDASTASFISFPNAATTTYGTQYALNQTIDTTVTIGGDSFAFVGWNDGNSLYRSGSSYLIGASDITLTAIWVRVFGVRYIANGGTFAAGDSAVDTECLGANSVCTDQQGIAANSAPTRTGYNFGGWLAQNNESISAGANFTVAANRYLLSAQWTPINYTITYLPNGGSSTPTETTKQIGQNFTVANAISRTGYTFAGWSDGINNFGAGANYTIGSNNVTLTAQWTPNVYTISYDWNGGRGSAESDATYTVGNNALTLPLVGDRVKDGYVFSGWSTTPTGDLIGLTYTPTESKTLYAIWGTGSYTVAFNAGRGNNANNTNSIQVQNGNATTLPLPTRANFVFDGWYDSETGGTKVANHGDVYQPTRSRTLYARWIQSSIYGIPTNARTRIGQSRASNTVGTTFTGANANSAVSVNVPAGALPENTDIFFDLVSDFTRAQNVISNNHDYIVSMAVYWLTPDETVPDTNAGKAIQLTITNSSIKAGASAYAIINNQSVLLGTATQDGTITVSLTSDPEVVIAATKPGTPTNVSATSNGDQQSVVSWSAPASTGGADITSYTATASNGQSCTTSTLTCTITGLSNGTSYTFTVKATNSVGDSDASTSASATTATVYTVTFDAKGGTAVNSGSFLTNGTVSEPIAPTKSGYTFAGWSDTDGGNAVTFNYTPGVTNNITLYALWSANTYIVTFNSNSGSAVADGSFTTGGTVAEPAAPTRSGYTFAGWSATDGGAAVTFPYSPNATADITLFAKWTAVQNQGGGNNNNNNNGNNNGGNNNNDNNTSGAATNPGVIKLKPVEVVGSSQAKVPTVDLPIKEKVVTPSGTTIVTTVKVAKSDEKYTEAVKIVNNQLAIIPAEGFSGRRVITVTVNEGNQEKIIEVPLVVLPEPVRAPVVIPTSARKTTIDWKASPNADKYEVFVDGKRVCSTAKTECAVNRLIGPNSVVEIVSNGGDRTRSEAAPADYDLEKPVQVVQLAGSARIKPTISASDKAGLDKVIALIKKQGFGTVIITNVSFTKSTKAASEKRLAAIKDYIEENIGKLDVEFEIKEPTKKTFINTVLLQS